MFCLRMENFLLYTPPLFPCQMPVGNQGDNKTKTNKKTNRYPKTSIIDLHPFPISCMCIALKHTRTPGPMDL